MNRAANVQTGRQKEFKDFGLEKQIEEINGAGAYHVDSREFKKYWKKELCFLKSTVP